MFNAAKNVGSKLRVVNAKGRDSGSTVVFSYFTGICEQCKCVSIDMRARLTLKIQG